MLDKLFQLSERGTTVKTEILAGITTFITMAYILSWRLTFLVSEGWIKMQSSSLLP